VDTASGVAIAGIVLSILTVYLSYRNGREAREDAHALSREAREADAAETRRVRLHDARKAVYFEVLEHALRIEDAVERTERRITWTGEPGPPEWPTDVERRRLVARIGLHASAAMRAKLTDLGIASDAFRLAVQELKDAQETGGELAGLRARIDATRAAVQPIVNDVIEIANRELAD
jgi:hypothetical protein